MAEPPSGVDARAARVVALLRDRDQTLAVAESLTGGLLGATVTTVPGASLVLRGGVIAYATDLKALLLGVPAPLLAQRGAVDPDVAAAMASGARELCRATWGVALTGVAGPDPQDGQPAGTVYAAVAGPSGVTVSRLALAGDRAAVRTAAAAAALDLLVTAVAATGAGTA